VHRELTKLPTEDLQHIEIEVKLGTITEKNSLKRMRLPVATECVLDPAYKDPSIYFNASVNEVYYKQTVSFLDDLVKTKRSNGDGDKLEAYPNQYNLDLFYDSPWDSSKVRVSLNENNQLIEGVTKRTLANLEVYSPGDLVDFRISINLETPVADQVLSELQASQTAPKFQREKKRLTYMQSVLKIDLTSVDMPMQQKKKQQASLGALSKKEDEATKEIEIELNPNVVLECFQLDQDNTTRDDNEPGNMEMLFGYLLNNTRLIIRNFSRSRGDA
jgi:polynucleotide 5'-triphosphatase